MKWTHIALTVSDLSKSREFYESYTDLVCVHHRIGEDGTPVAWLADSDLESRFVLVLIQSEQAAEVLKPINHLGWSVESQEQVDAIAARARRDGCLQMEPEYLDDVAGYLCMIRDPDGNAVEFSYGQDLA